MKRVFITALASVFFTPMLASAQTPPPHDPASAPASDITQIIRGILGELPNPDGVIFPQSSGLQSFPVRVRLPEDSSRSQPSAGEWLVISAYAPRPQNPDMRGELLGETRLLLRGLTAPYEVRVDVPAAAQQDFTYITGRIEDRNGAVLLDTIGGQIAQTPNAPPAELMMGAAQNPDASALPPTTPITAETVLGHVTISGPQEIFRGARLTVQLIEAGLAGGQGTLIRGEKQSSIDGLNAPYRFNLNYGVPKGGFKMPLQLQAFITDWAGRKTHVMAKAVDYKGPDFDYQLILDAFRQGSAVTQFDFSAPVAVQSEIQGQAVFQAPRGLPNGAYLRLRLLSPLGPNGAPRELTSKIIPVNAGSSPVDFSLLAPSVNFDPELPAPVLNITLESPEGVVFFARENVETRENTHHKIHLNQLQSY